MRFCTSKYAIVLLFSVLIIGCKDDEDPLQPKTPLTIPAQYDTTGYVAATKQQFAWRKAFVDAVNHMKKAKVKGVTVTESEITALLETSDFDNLISAYYKQIVTQYVQELAKASGGTYDPFKSPAENGNGGVFGAYLFEEHGLELEQCIEKGLFGAALYNYAASTYLTGNVTSEKLSQAMVLYGADPSFPNTNTAANTTKPDIQSALYAARRDDNSGEGFYRQIQKNFLTAQAAAKAGASYNEELQGALKGIRENWEKALAATFVNYMYAAASGLSKTNATPDEIASALHAYAEGVGFIHGLKGASSKIITDKDVDDILTLLLAKNLNETTTYLFVQDPAKYLPNLIEAQSILKKAYGFSDAQMEAFRKNWISEQKR